MDVSKFFSDAKSLKVKLEMIKLLRSLSNIGDDKENIAILNKQLDDISNHMKATDKLLTGITKDRENKVGLFKPDKVERTHTTPDTSKSPFYDKLKKNGN